MIYVYEKFKKGSRRLVYIRRRSDKDPMNIHWDNQIMSMLMSQPAYVRKPDHETRWATFCVFIYPLKVLRYTYEIGALKP